jgi:dienelactone hydrolase
MIALKHIAASAALALLAGCGGAGAIAGGGILKSGLAAGGNVTGIIAAPSPNGTVQIPFRLVRPAGDGPFPAVVVMHDCSGLGPHSSGSPLRWARKLVAAGYVVMIPDSFTPRGFPDGVCTNNRAQAASPFVRSGDALAALAYLRSLPYVDGDHIGLMGGSHGGSTTLATMVDRGADPQAGSQRSFASPDAVSGFAETARGFAAAIAFYPGCGFSYGQWRIARRSEPDRLTLEFDGVYKPAAPLLILIGEKDDWTPAAYCQKLAEAAQGAGYAVSIKIYPGALHAFDSNYKVTYNPDRNNANKPGGRGATTGGDPAAWADAEQQVAEFFGRYLKSAD